MLDGVHIMFLTLYAIIKDLLVFWKPKEKRQVQFPLQQLIIVLTLIFSVMTIVVVIPLVLFRKCVGIYLRFTQGKLYGGFLTGQDLIFEAYADKTVFNVVIVMSTEDEWPIIYKKIWDCAKNIHNSSYKFSCNIQRCLGYCYFLKDQVNFERDNIMTYQKVNENEYLSRDMLLDFLEKNCKTIKKNHMWKLIFLSQPIKWNENTNEHKKQYPAILTFRHSLGDGPTVAGILRKNILVEDSVSNKDVLKAEREKASLILNNVYVHRNPMITKLDEESLKIEGNSNWHLLSFTESTSKYLSKIRKIKKELKVGFTEVVAAAICSSISDYILQRKVKMDKYTMAFIIRVMDKELKEIIRGTYNFKELVNNSAVIALDIPVKRQKMKDNILYLHDCGELMKNAVDFFLVYGFLNNIVTYLPISLVKLFEQSYMEGMTVGISNMTGFGKSNFFGTSIDDMFWFTPAILKTGFTFSILSYNEKLQITLTSREGFVYSRKDLQNIINNILRKIDQIDAEIFP